MSNTINPGQTKRYACADCDTEFEVCLEPKEKGSKQAETGRDEKGHCVTNRVETCPFCASGDVEEV